jgi:hypothetical protein
MGFYAKERTLDFFQKTRILETITADKGPFRVFATRKTIAMETPIFVPGGTPLDVVKAKHLPTMNLLYGVHDLWGIDVMNLKRTVDLYGAFTGSPSLSATNLVDLYSVKYIISTTSLEGDPRFEIMDPGVRLPPGSRDDFSEYTVKLYRHKNPLPRGWLVKECRVMDSKAILSAVTRKDFSPRREALLEEEPELLPVKAASSSRQNSSSSPQPRYGERIHADAVEFVSESNNHLRLRVRTTENSLLVLSDTYFPGWKAWVNGTEKKIYRVNYAFRALSLGPGDHRVEFIYAPLSFKLGVWITFAGISGCLLLAGISRKRENRLSQ